MNSASFVKKTVLALLPMLAVHMGATAFAAETITLDDGTTCAVLDSAEDGHGTSTTVTAGDGRVSSSVTIDGKTTTAHSGEGSVSSSAGSATAGGGSDAFSTASVTRPDGTVITRRSDGTCDITKPAK